MRRRSRARVGRWRGPSGCGGDRVGSCAGRRRRGAVARRRPVRGCRGRAENRARENGRGSFHAPDVTRGGDARQDELGVADGGEGDEDGAGDDFVHRLGDAEGELRLADATRPEQGHQSDVGPPQQLGDGRDIEFPADERGERQRPSRGPATAIARGRSRHRKGAVRLPESVADMAILGWLRRTGGADHRPEPVAGCQAGATPPPTWRVVDRGRVVTRVEVRPSLGPPADRPSARAIGHGPLVGGTGWSAIGRIADSNRDGGDSKAHRRRGEVISLLEARASCKRR